LAGPLFMEPKLLRDRLADVALEWENKYGVSLGTSPRVTPAIAEYDAARLIGVSEEKYGELDRGRGNAFYFIYKGKRYRTRGSRHESLSERPEGTVIYEKPTDFEWDYFIFILYRKSYVIEEAWLWEAASYKEFFDQNDKMSFNDMRQGKYLEEDSQKPWLEKLLDKRRSLKWCVKSYCTTCGCRKFRDNVIAFLSRKIGFQLPDLAGHRLLWDALSPNDATLCFKEIVTALDELPKSNLDNHDNQALEVILIDLYAMKLVPLLSSSQPYGDIIKGTWVEEEFSVMDDAAARRFEIQKEQAEYNSPALVKEREAKKRIEKEELRIATQKKVEDRLEKSSQRKLEINAFLDDFSQSDEKSRLLALASKELNVPLEVIPHDLIPVDPEIVSILSREDKDRLMCRIDRRRGVLGELKAILNR
jgi:hypothetical protein